MLETNNPDINVNELMEKIQEEVANRKPRNSEDKSLQKETLIGKVNTINIQALLNNAEYKAQLRSEWPKKFNRFPFNSAWIQKLALKVYNFLLKEQRAVNFSLIQAGRESVTLKQHLSEQVTALQIQVSTFNARLNQLQEEMNRISDRLQSNEERFQGLSDRLQSNEERFQGLSDRLQSNEERFQGLSDRLQSNEERFQGLSDHLQSNEERFQGLSARLNVGEQRLTATNELYIRNDSYLKSDLSQQKRLIALFLEEARQRLPGSFSPEQMQALVNEEQHFLDTFYVAFEDRFRGSRQEIAERLKVYLPRIAKTGVGTQDSPILDIGCGRGEWLELLQESEYVAKGLDINRVMVEQCRDKGLEVIESDVIDYLQSLPDSSLGAVTGFHIIEHLPFAILLKLFNEVLRVLKPGGLAIFETPNPQNLLVGACDFYADPTHRSPLYPPTIQFILQYQGFLNVELLYLNPVEISPFDQEGSGWQTLRNLFFACRDYAVIGFKV
jgi:SAM-dependent methyltransferase